MPESNQIDSTVQGPLTPTAPADYSAPAPIDSPASHSKPLVTVVVPYYNHPLYLLEAVESALSQNYENVEVIVVDDGSVVSAISILDTDTLLKRYDSRTLSVLSKPNGGVASARNLGFAHSHGEFLVFLDSDDRLSPGAIQAQLLELQNDPAAGMVFGAAAVIDKTGKQIDPPSICRPRPDYFLMLLQGNPIACPGGVLFRRSSLEQVGIFDESYMNAEDYQLYLRVARELPVLRHERLVVEYRRHGGGKSENKQRMTAAVMRIFSELEQSGKLTRSQIRRLRHGRQRWLHVFKPESTLRYRLMGLYFSVVAMTAVPISSYFRKTELR